MFTIKLYSYSDSGSRCVVKSAESFTILRSDDGLSEITLHQKDMREDSRVDLAPKDMVRPDDWPPIFQKAIIENASGRTTEILTIGALKPPTIPLAA